MAVPDHFWHQVGDAKPAEQKALDVLRALLPDAPTTRAWANVTFRDREGRAAEVDVILVHHNGFYLLELKGWHGAITGNQTQWRVTDPNGRPRTERDPFIANNQKAQRLNTELRALLATRRRAGGPGLPFLQAVTVMHGLNSTIELTDQASTHVFGLDGYRVTGVPPLSDLLMAPIRDERSIITQPRAAAIAALIDELGLTPTPLVRRVSQYEIDSADPLGEGPGWEDRRAVHPALKEHRRIRLYDLPPTASAKERQEIDRNARREYLLVKNLDHRGIVKPLELLTPPDEGPALIFPDDRDDVPLLTHLAQALLEFGERVALIRSIGEVATYAHQRGVQHRALSPLAVRIRTTDGRVMIRDWQAGSGTPGADVSRTSVYSGVTEPAAMVASDALLYLAPEAHRPNPEPVPLDVYGLGALAYLILTDSPPAANLGALQERLKAGGLDPATDRDGLQQALCDAVRSATEPDVTLRTATVAAFLSQVESAVAPADPQPEPVADPREATAGTEISERWGVESRLGEGSSGVALLVSDYTLGVEGLVLKVAVDSHATARIRSEGEVLQRLRHPRVAELIEGPLDVAGHTAILLADAGRPTLEERIVAEGRLTLEQLENYGTDLFEAVGYLESQGVFHRDIKPANLGVREQPGEGRSRHLVLFDFSLATEPLAKVASGTAGYLDPFLGHGTRRQYDSAAERFAVAATLFRMATTETPVWGDGLSEAALLADEVHLAPGLFEPEIAQRMMGFFRQALARQSTARFDDLESMSRAWSALFPNAKTSLQEDASPQERDASAARATPTTPLNEAGLTARAVSAARRLGAETVRELLDASPVKINNLPGAGVEVRRELQRRRKQWAARLAPATSTAEDAADVLLRGVEATQEALIPKGRAKAAAAAPVARRLLNIEVPHQGSGWPDHATAASQAGIPGDPASHLDALCAYWAKQQSVRQLAAELEQSLQALGGTATVAELAERLVALRGSTAEGPQRRRNATGLIRAVIEADAGSAFALLRHGDQVFLTTTSDELADFRLEAAAQLASAVDAALDGAGGPLGLNAGLEVVRSIPTSDDVGIPDPQRLVALACRGSATGAVSSRGELYLRGMPASQAVRAVVSASPAQITAERIRALTASRFPDAQPAPDRPALDQLVRQANEALAWSQDARAYTRTGDSIALISTMTRYGPAVVFDEVHEALTSSLAARSATVVTASPHRMLEVPRLLGQRYGVAPVDITAELVRAMRQRADQAGVDWALVLRADAAAPDSGDRANLHRLVADATDAFWPTLLADPRPLLLTDVATLARYGQMERVARLLDLATERPAARWLLVPKRAGVPAPTLDGTAIPVASGTWVELAEGLRESA